MKIFRPLALSLSLLLGSALLSTATNVAADAAADDRFNTIREAFRVGDVARLERLTNDFYDYELEDYVTYYRLVIRMRDPLDPLSARLAIHDFLSRQDRSYLAEKLRGDWLKVLAKRQEWTEFDAEYPKLITPEQDVVCYALLSRRSKGDMTMLDDTLPLWLSLADTPEPCLRVLEMLVYEKRVTVNDVWARMRRQVEANKLGGVRYTANFLPPSQSVSAAQLSAALDKPMPMLARLPYNWADTPLDRELVTLAIGRVARSDPRMAAEQMERLGDKLSDDGRSWAWGQIGWQGAYAHMPEATAWYRRAGNIQFSDEVMQWEVRAALRAQDWGLVRSTIEQMPKALAALPEWVYWLGRAYKAGGRVSDANALFQRISGQPNFYGNLADDELDRPIKLPPKAAAVSRDELLTASNNPGLRRALALIRVGARTEGVREWNWSLRGMTDRELLAAADLAKRNQVFDRAIAAADRTKSEHDYSIRYMSPYDDQVRPAAQRQSVDEAWVYGLMRQESRFITSAKSNVGASGLMQLMPATAKWVANKIGLSNYHQGKVHDTDVNVLLGTSYMRMVMEDLDNHPVLASAAYNAGPGRARKWRADRPLEGAIYAETIPFTETRDYVKKVMSNSVYYQALFDGRAQSLKSRLGVIGPRSDAPTSYLP